LASNTGEAASVVVGVIICADGYAWGAEPAICSGESVVALEELCEEATRSKRNGPKEMAKTYKSDISDIL